MVTFLTDVEYVPRSRLRKSPKPKGSGAVRGLAKEFIAWDGEGWTNHVCGTPDSCRNSSGACKHHYYLFGASSGHFISGVSLGTTDCFDLMLEAESTNPDAIHVSFSFKYDLDMIFRDIPIPAVRVLIKQNRMRWNGYYIEVLPGKWLQVTKDGVTCRIYDLFSFFACSFVKALEMWNVGTKAQRDKILAGKEQRGTFTLDNLETDVIPYWREELQLLVQLANSLRDILYSAGIKPSKWHGPGAVADYLFRENKTQVSMPEYDSIPTKVLDAGQYAYAGGRFEAFRIGFYEGPIYSADINSAYPYAMSLLPDMATGTWIHYDGLPPGDDGEGQGHYRLAMYHVRYAYGEEANRAICYGGMPAGAHYRYPKSGTMHFRNRNPGVWIHRPEFATLLDQYRLGMFSQFDVMEAWVYVDDGTYPFAWVRETYAQRRVWKDEGNPAQLAAKLGINSLYGKLAQRIGGKEGVPTWHNLQWAGHITSTCRAMLYGASWKQYADLVAYETDGVYSTSPIENLPNGSGLDLGQWEVNEYSGILYLQSGVYWLRDMEGVWLKPKTRGVPQQHMEFDRAYDSLVNKTELTVQQNQFIRFGLADMRRDGNRIWRTWQINEKDFSFGGHGLGSAGKRIHIDKSCKECIQGYGHHETLHTLMLSPKGFAKVDGAYRESAPHYLPWRKIGSESVNTRKTEILKRWGDADS
jgi:hypothetical protein